MSKYKVIAKKTITIGKSLNGGTKASNNLSSILFPVFETKTLTLLTSILATNDLISKEIIIAIIIIERSPRLTPNTPSPKTLLICEIKLRISSMR